MTQRTLIRVIGGLLVSGAVVFSAVMVTVAHSLAGSDVHAAAPARAPAASLIVLGDTVRGPEGLSPADLPALACVQQSRFPQGSTIVFRMRVIDPDTSDPLDDTQVVSLTLTLADGTMQALHYGPHPPTGTPTDVFWTTAWAIPADYPTGALEYRVEAVDQQGRTGTHRAFNVAPSVLQVVPAGTR